MPSDRSQRFRTWLDRQIQNLDMGAKLPDTEALAKKWRMSRTTLSQILQEYAAEGRITRIRRLGTFVGSPQPEDLDAESAQSMRSSDQVGQQLRASILRGELRHGHRLPPVSRLSEQYTVSPRTVTTALRELLNKGMLQQAGRRYLVTLSGKQAQMQSGRVIHVYLASGLNSMTCFHEDGLSVAYRACEKELRNHQFRWILKPARTLIRDLGAWGNQGNPPSGALLWGWSRADAQTIQAPLAEYIRKGPTAGFHCLVDASGSVAMGSVRHITTLSRARLWRYICRSLLEEVCTRGHTGATVITLFAEDQKLVDVYRSEAARQLQGFRIESHSEYLAPDPECAIINADSFLARFSRHADPIFDGLLRSDKPLCWLFGSDAAAALAMDWANRRRISVPRRLGICGLMNDSRFIHLGISTLSAEWERLGFRMAQSFIGNIPPTRSPRGFLRHGGDFIDRGTL